MALAPPGPTRLASVVRTFMSSRTRVFMWTDIRPSAGDYKIGKMQELWYKLVIRHAQPTYGEGGFAVICPFKPASTKLAMKSVNGTMFCWTLAPSGAAI